MDSKNNIEKDLITLVFTQDEANTLIKGLGCLPFKDVYKIIEKIHIQANARSKNKGTE
jgi:hypothetical protein